MECINGLSQRPCYGKLLQKKHSHRLIQFPWEWSCMEILVHTVRAIWKKRKSVIHLLEQIHWPHFFLDFRGSFQLLWLQHCKKVHPPILYGCRCYCTKVIGKVPFLSFHSSCRIRVRILLDSPTRASWLGQDPKEDPESYSYQFSLFYSPLIVP